MILGLVLYAAIICAFAAMLRFMKHASSSRLIHCIREGIHLTGFAGKTPSMNFI